jgi:glycosyltransferase involved in cell wall biosynthesis
MEKVLRQLGVTSRIEVVPNGVDLLRIHQARPCSREEFSFAADDVLLVYAGRIAQEKNLDFLLRSFAGVAQAIDRVHLMVVGGGQQPHMDDLKSLVIELNIQGRVHFTGMVPYEELPSYLAMCDAFVTASVTEVHPLSVIEAMGAGLPVVGIHSPGVSDTVDHGLTGLLSTHDLAAYTAHLTRLCLDLDLLRRMGEAARRESTQYAIERTTQLMLKLYERMVYASRPRQRRWDARLRSLLERFLS